MEKIGAVDHLKNLDGVRGYAALMVLMLHGSYGFFKGGWVGVDLFFTLSGFLITTILYREYKRRNTISFRKFYIRRALRLFPALLGGIILANICWSFTHGFVMEEARRGPSTLAALFYFSNLVVGPVLGNMGHFWSLAVEEHFYLFWPLVLFGLLRFFRIKIIIALLAVVVVAVCYFRLQAGREFPRESWGIFTIDPYTFTLFRVDGILLGAILALVLERFPFSIATAKQDPVTSTLALTGCAAAFAYIIFYMGKEGVYYNGGLILVDMVCIATLFTAVRWRNHFFLSNKVAAWFGKRSYGIYVYHFPIFLLLENMRTAGDNVNFILVFLLRFSLTFLVAAASYKWLEAPFLRYKNRFTSQRIPVDGSEGATRQQFKCS